MVNGFNSHDDMVNSVCDGFIKRVNDVVPNNIELLCNQDAYEILTDAFGNEFQKHDIENASIEQINSIAKELSEFLEKEVSAEEVCGFINGALKQSFGDCRTVQYKT
ncbi:MAG: hypothetical protein HLX50_14000 [Alteromonadaceae bacterium]|nr:hypothetical protein [Alteromonadaceae bacterium]